MLQAARSNAATPGVRPGVDRVPQPPDPRRPPSANDGCIAEWTHMLDRIPSRADLLGRKPHVRRCGVNARRPVPQTTRKVVPHAENASLHRHLHIRAAGCEVPGLHASKAHVAIALRQAAAVHAHKRAATAASPAPTGCACLAPPSAAAAALGATPGGRRPSGRPAAATPAAPRCTPSCPPAAAASAAAAAQRRLVHPLKGQAARRLQAFRPAKLSFHPAACLTANQPPLPLSGPKHTAHPRFSLATCRPPLTRPGERT